MDPNHDGHSNDPEIDLDADYQRAQSRHADTESFHYDLDLADGDALTPRPTPKGQPGALNPISPSSGLGASGSYELESVDLDGSPKPTDHRGSARGASRSASDRLWADPSAEYEVESLDLDETAPPVGKTQRGIESNSIDPNYLESRHPASASGHSVDSIDLDHEFNEAKSARAKAQKSESGAYSVDSFLAPAPTAPPRRRPTAPKRPAARRPTESPSAIAAYQKLKERGDAASRIESMQTRFALRSLIVAASVIALLLGVAQWGIYQDSEWEYVGFVAVVVLGLGGLHAAMNIPERQKLLALERLHQADAGETSYLNAARSFPDRDDPQASATPQRHGVVPPWRLFTEPPGIGIVGYLGAGALSMVGILLVWDADSLTQAAASVGAITISGFAIQVAELNSPRFVVLAWWLALAGFVVVALLKAIGY